MTNEEAKQEAIKKAFAKSWNILSYSMQQHILNVHYWVDRSHNRMNKSPNDLNFDELSECEVHCEFWRPIQLKGIEDNNGWIRIEPDGSNLPTDQSIYYKLIVSGFEEVKVGFFDTIFLSNKPKWLYKDSSGIWDYKGVTHYKPIKPELKPIY